MKTLAPWIAAGLALLPMAAVADSKPTVTLAVKKQVIASDHDLHGKQGSSREQTITLRVEIQNVSNAAIEHAKLSGDALVSRAGELRERVVKESLAAVDVPTMKPNQKLTIDLGKLHLGEFELNHLKFEESLKEWKVACTSGNVEIGQAVSSDRYATVAAQAVAVPEHIKPIRRFAR